MIRGNEKYMKLIIPQLNLPVLHETRGYPYLPLSVVESLEKLDKS